MNTLSCFKSYDVRGKVPEELNENIAYRIGRAYVQCFKPKAVAVGYDIRLTSKALCNSLSKGITDAGADVINIGQCGTEEIYFAAATEAVDGGICVTASHNPKDFNGMKFVGESAKPISSSNGLKDIEALVAGNIFSKSEVKGRVTDKTIEQDYIEHVLSYIDISKLSPLKIVVNAGNGGAGHIIDLLESHLPFEFIKLNHQADGNFPNGVPNPLLVENRVITQQAVIANKADLGIAWDGDFDRCFFFDETGEFIEGYYLVGLLASTLLKKNPGSAIIHDPRLYWNTIEMVSKAGGKAVVSKTGHSFLKEAMREHNAIYGGEMSAHHYFKEFAYCDNGTIPWLLICELIAQSKTSLSYLVSECKNRYPCSGEINLTITQTEQVLGCLNDHYKLKATKVDNIDGLGIEFDNWRFNVRMSNTEPLLRVNIETRGDQQLLREKTDELLTLISTFEG